MLKICSHGNEILRQAAIQSNRTIAQKCVYTFLGNQLPRNALKIISTFSAYHRGKHIKINRFVCWAKNIPSSE